MTRHATIAAAAALALAACTDKGPDPLEEARRLQSDIRRAIITSKSLGRYGTFALFQEDLATTPCREPLSTSNRVCQVRVVGAGEVRMRVADPSLAESGRVSRDALLSVEYEADCEREKFDYKTFDGVLPRTQRADGEHVWADHLVRVTHRRLPGPQPRCSVSVEAAPELIARIAG